ncbi:pirin family protein [Granulosicoccaceae sp. 1_MG-2023]|nr:pirin family protein [Granulosicoccaceae sp. 1_MG-2023]
MRQVAFIKRSDGGHWVGDGFPVRTIFSYNDIAGEVSPFLLLDYAGPHHFEPTTQKRGVGAHPHRGFETVTIVYEGAVSHRDSAGGGGTIGAGDVQWMTAGAGVIHEEFHSEDFARRGGDFEMVQLWVNLPAKDKMTGARYQSIADAQIPRVSLPGEAGTARLIAGEYDGTRGAAETFSELNVWDLRLRAGKTVLLALPPTHTASLFVLRGAVQVGEKRVAAAELAVFENSDAQLQFQTTDDTLAVLLSGEPLNEPIAAHGPFVMNSREELLQAMRDYQSGQFGRIPQ